MARQRRRGNRRDNMERGEEASRPKSLANFVGNTNRVGSVDDYMLGFANLSRSFDYDTSRTRMGRRPPFFLRNCFPQIAFYEGFSASAAPSAGVNTDIGAAIDNTVTDIDSELYPVTPYAQQFESTVWPTIQNILRGGLGQRVAVSFSAFVRYIASTHVCYCSLRDAVTLNILAFHYDWSKVFPFSDVVPKEIQAWAGLLNCDDAGMARYWIPRMQRLEARIMFPGWMHETRQALKPLLSLEMAPELWIPRFTQRSEFSSIIEGIDNSLDYVEVELGDVEAVLKSFLPFPISQMDPWRFDEPAPDVMRWNGFINEGLANYTTFGTGSVDVDSNLRFNGTVVNGKITPADDGVDIKWLTQTEAPIWAALKYGGFFMDATNPTLTEHLQIGMHQTANVAIVSDTTATTIANMITAFSASLTIEGRDQAWFRNLRFAGARGEGIDDGYFMPGHILGTVEGEGLLRLVELQCLADFSFQALQRLSVITLGRSLREVQRTLLELIYNSA